MKTEVKSYCDAIVASFSRFCTGGPSKEYNEQRIQEFKDKIRVDYGKKYAKVITRNSVHSFVCLVDDGKFKVGDILKAASYSAPAKNFARGNVFSGDFDYVEWTGA